MQLIMMGILACLMGIANVEGMRVFNRSATSPALGGGTERPALRRTAFDSAIDSTPGQLLTQWPLKVGQTASINWTEQLAKTHKNYGDTVLLSSSLSQKNRSEILKEFQAIQKTLDTLKIDLCTGNIKDKFETLNQLVEETATTMQTSFLSLKEQKTSNAEKLKSDKLAYETYKARIAALKKLPNFIRDYTNSTNTNANSVLINPVEIKKYIDTFCAAFNRKLNEPIQIITTNHKRNWLFKFPGTSIDPFESDIKNKLTSILKDFNPSDDLPQDQIQAKFNWNNTELDNKFTSLINDIENATKDTISSYTQKLKEYNEGLIKYLLAPFMTNNNRETFNTNDHKTLFLSALLMAIAKARAEISKENREHVLFLSNKIKNIRNKLIKKAQITDPQTGVGQLGAQLNSALESIGRGIFLLFGAKELVAEDFDNNDLNMLKKNLSAILKIEEIKQSLHFPLIQKMWNILIGATSVQNFEANVKNMKVVETKSKVENNEISIEEFIGVATTPDTDTAVEAA